MVRWPRLVPWVLQRVLLAPLVLCPQPRLAPWARLALVVQLGLYRRLVRLGRLGRLVPGSPMVL